MKFINNERGYALLTVVLISLLFIGIAITLINLTVNGANKTQVRSELVQATELADKGLDHITSQINQELIKQLEKSIAENDGMGEEDFKRELETLLNLYLCEGGTGKVENFKDNDGKYEVCIDSWGDTDGPLKNVLKEVVFKSTGIANKREKPIYTTVQMGTDELENNDFETETPGGKLDVVLVLDATTSMSSEDVKSLRESSRLFIDETVKSDTDLEVAIVRYHDYPVIMNEFLGYEDKATLIENSYLTMDDLGHGTNIQSGFYYGRRMLNEKSDADVKLMILLTDGDPNAGYAALETKPYDKWPRYIDTDSRYRFETDFDHIVTKFDYQTDYEDECDSHATCKGSLAQDQLPKIPGISYLGSNSNRDITNLMYARPKIVLNTISEAKIAIDSGIDVYTIGMNITSDEKAIYTMENSQNKGFYSAKNPAELKKVFEALAKAAQDSLEELNKGNLVQKPMPPKIIDRDTNKD